MGKIKAVYLIFDTFLVGICGLTIIDLLTIVNLGDYSFVDDAIKTILAFAGLFYLIAIKIPHEWRNNKLNREIKKKELEKLEMENEDFKDTHNNN